MPEFSGRKLPPSWLRFHKDGLVAVLILDSLWMFMEVAAGASIVGIPAILFIHRFGFSDLMYHAPLIEN